MGWVDPCQRKNKNGYYQSFKIRFGGRIEIRPESLARLTVNPNQFKDKNSYYNSFEIRINGWSGVRPESRVKMVNSGQHKTKMVIIIILKLDLRVNSRQDPTYGLEKSTWVDSS
jgi:hypothetical protein